MADMVAEFARYMACLGEGLGYATRTLHLSEYCGALMLPLKRKSVEPLAAEADPRNVPAKHQALLHFVGNAPWSDRALLDQIRGYVEPHLGLEQGAFWIVDDTGHRKYGSESVGVAHQYCGNLGKDDNCQVAVSLSLASARGSVPMDYRLYLPKSWAFDRKRRGKAHVPEEIVFQTKPEIALSQIEAARERGVVPGVVIADAAYGSDTAWREALSELGLRYAVGVLSSTTVWPPGVKPLPPARYCGRGIVPSKLRRGPGHEPVSLKQLALQLKASAWHRVTWREGTNKTLASRFACVRVRAAHRDYQRSSLRAQEWLLIEWPRAQAEPIKYWLSSLPADTALERLVDTAKMRWRIEHDYHELKQEFGLSHYEGRGWRGFHHHATLCIAAYGFLTAQRLNEGSKKNAAARPKTSSLSKDHQSRARRQSTAPRARLDSDAAISNRL
jgi:SRSO17 transposase